MIKSFLDLKVYKESLSLAVEVEKLVRKFPKHEQYLLSDQIRRASRAIGPLIAEGYAKRSSVKNFKRYIKDALGEANEMISHLQIAQRIGYIKPLEYGDKLTQKYVLLTKKLYNLQSNWQNYS